MSAELIEKATRKQYRFDSPQSPLSVEDLWTLLYTSTRPNRANLLDIAKDLSQQIKENGVDDELEALFGKTTKKNTELSEKYEIVKYIIKVRKAEDEETANAAVLRKANADRRKQLKDIIAQKELEGLVGTDLEQLKAMLLSMNVEAEEEC